MNTYILDENNVKLLGRTYLSPDNILWCHLSGTGAGFYFTGKKLAFELMADGTLSIDEKEENYARYAVYVDGKRLIDDVLDRNKKVVEVINSENDVSARIWFVKISEAQMSGLGILPVCCDGRISPLEKKPLKIEVIGDSITCGYGIDDEDPEHHFVTPTEDCTRAYAIKAIREIDADYSLFSLSGWGIISGYTEDDIQKTDQRLPEYYEKLAFCRRAFTENGKPLYPQEINWDFSRFVPKLIVINLGTNDDSFCKDIKERSLDYAKNYTEFLKAVHNRNPESKILCCLGIMGDRLFPYVEKAVNDFKADTGFKDIYTLKFTEQDISLGYAADYHPISANHITAARELVKKMREII